MVFDEKPELNITPLVDVMLVLLAILMVTVPTVTYQENIKLPQGSKIKSSSTNAKSLIISISKEKEIYIGKKKFDFLSFADNLELIKQSHNLEEMVFIRADKNLRYDDVIFVLKNIKNLGFRKVALQTE